MGKLLSGLQPSEKTPERPLDSWKQIAAYLNRDVRTVQRWEKREGMPVHRQLHDKLGSVYAYSSELDAWLESRRVRLEEEESEQRTATAVEEEPYHEPRQAWVVRRWFVLAGVALLTVITLAYVTIQNRPKPATQPKITSVAVLPLKNFSGDPTQEYLADGMTEAVIGRLSMIGGLRVISRTSVMQLKDTPMSAPEIAKTLHVDALVEGSVIREGNRVRVHAQLIRGPSDEHFWSEEYDRELGDALALERDVAQSIAQRVEVTITGVERVRLVAARHVAPEVYESYLKGEDRLSKSSKADVEESVSYFQEAIRKDPAFAPAYVGLANAYDFLGTVLIGGPPGETRGQVINAANKALQLDPELAEAHVLLADVYQERWQWNDAETEYKRAFELKPNDVTSHRAFANWLLCQGRTEEALVWSQRARELDPLADLGVDIGWILFHARRYEEAIREFRAVLAVHPDDAVAQWDLGFALIANGKPDEAITVLNRALALTDGSPGVKGVLVRAYAHAGHRSDALHLVDDLKHRRQTEYIPAAAFVNAYLGLGDNEEAFRWLEEACKEHSNILQYLKVGPFFDPLRDDPRFRDLLRRVGLDQSH